MNIEDARRIAALALAGDPLDLVILDEYTLNRSWGWVFRYQSRRYLETGEDRYLLGGNAPLIVDRETGRCLVTGTAHDIEFYLQNFERTGDPHKRPGPIVRVDECVPRPRRAVVAALRVVTGEPISAITHKLDSAGPTAEFDAGTPQRAAELIVGLRAMGVTCRQMPETAW